MKVRLYYQVLERFYDFKHPLRGALQKLHTLDPIRIIEGKA